MKSFAGALGTSGVDKAQVAGAGFGVAGCDFPSDRAPHLQAIAVLGLSCPVEVVNDGVNGLLAGATRGIGVNVTAGSSNNCRGRNHAGKEGRVVGNGSPFGEFGGAHEILARGLQMVNYAWIKRIPPTVLTKIYVEAVGAKDEMDLMEGLSNETYHLFPYIVLQIVDAARAGDYAAREILKWAGEELGMLAVSVARQIDMAVQANAVQLLEGAPLYSVWSDRGNGLLVHAPGELVLRRSFPGVLELELRSWCAGGQVLVSGRADGWQAAVDGKPVPTDGKQPYLVLPAGRRINLRHGSLVDPNLLPLGNADSIR